VSDPAVNADQRFPLIAVVQVTGTLGEGALYPELSPGKSGLTKTSCALIDHLRSIDKRRVVVTGDLVASFRGTNDAFGHPGIEPRWTNGNKDGVGTAYSADSRVWFTLANGYLTEAYFPTIDRPQIRDLQYLVTDGETFFHDEKRGMETRTEQCAPHTPSYRITNASRDGRYRVIKEVIVAPHQPCVLTQTRLEGDDKTLDRLHLYALCAPHLDVGGWGNNAYVVEIGGRPLLAAEKNGIWLVIGATIPFSRLSCGYVGASDGWTDLAHDFKMDWQFDRALDGNVALTGELDLKGRREFTLGLAFGHGIHHAASALFQSLGESFETHREKFSAEWDRPARRLLPLDGVSTDGGRLYRGSYSLLLSHEDKTFSGGFIASLSIPWGGAKGDADQGGYHLVWTRDMVSTATGLLAAGDKTTPLRALIYLAASQHPDGGFPQNFWLNGDPYWRGVQLDEVAFPILLAWRLKEAGTLAQFDPYSMVLGAASYLVRLGPATEQERWEEVSGYSPSTLASNIVALLCAADFAKERGDPATAQFLGEYADFLEAHLEGWMVTTAGTLLADAPRHYIRIHPVDIRDPHPNEDPNQGMLRLANRPPGTRSEFPAREIVDAGFLELVRYGVRRPDDPIIVDSLRVVDALLKVDTPFGPTWRRYNHDGYGQRADGGPYVGFGQGRAWPLLTGERAHYEFAAGRDVTALIRALESFAGSTGLLPEQVWDEADRPDSWLSRGGSTGAARPLMWAHAEYLKLLRTVHDGKVFDLVPLVADRYLTGARKKSALEIWKPSRQPASIRPGQVLRVQVAAPFRLHFTMNEWQTAADVDSVATSIGIHYVDVKVPRGQTAPIRFTLLWTEGNRWEGRDYEVEVARHAFG
jgi:glucoamylase